MDQVLEISEDCVEMVDEQQLVELSFDDLNQIGGGLVGVTL